MKKIAAVILGVSMMFSGVQSAQANSNALKIVAGVVAVGGAAYLANHYLKDSREEQRERARQARYERQQGRYSDQYGYNSRNEYNARNGSNCRIVKKPVQIAEDTFKMVKVRECYNY